jgi:hypothetical protein
MNRRDLLDVLGVDGRIILKWTMETTECEDMDWISVIKHEGRRQASVSTVMMNRVA